VKAASDFVEHFFSLIDSDRNGYISFREFLNAVVLFSKGTVYCTVLKPVNLGHP
jgi:dual oxidase